MITEKGLAVWEYNPFSKEVKEAVFKPGSFFASVNNGDTSTTETFVLEEDENYFYFEALNRKNAIRKSKKYDIWSGLHHDVCLNNIGQSNMI